MKFLYEPVAVRRVDHLFLPEAAFGDKPLGKPEKVEEAGAKSKYPDGISLSQPRVPVFGKISIIKENTICIGHA